MFAKSQPMEASPGLINVSFNLSLLFWSALQVRNHTNKCNFDAVKKVPCRWKFRLKKAILCCLRFLRGGRSGHLCVSIYFCEFSFPWF